MLLADLFVVAAERQPGDIVSKPQETLVEADSPS